MDKLIWNFNMKSVVKDNRAIVANDETGMWIKISKECFEILNDAVKRNIGKSELLAEFEKEQDREYIEELINKLDSIGVWQPKETKPNRLEQVYVMLTHRCNLHCRHCSMNASQTTEEDYLNTERMIDLLDRVIKLKPEQIVLSGGEPLFRRDFNTILKYVADNYSGEIVVMTNATLITEENVDFIVNNVSSLDISIDGIDEETCAMIRGKGVFDRVVKNINLLHSRGFENISLSMVFGNSNYHLINQFYEMNKKLGTKAIPRAFSPIGRGSDLKESFNKVNESHHGEYRQDKLEDTLTACCCKACRKEFCVDYYGDIYPCVLLMKDKYKLGSIFRSEDINAVTNGFNINKLSGFIEFEKLHPEKIEKCKDCDLRLFCWSCLHFVDIYKDSDVFDERCASRKEALEKVVWGCKEECKESY